MHRKLEDGEEEKEEKVTSQKQNLNHGVRNTISHPGWPQKGLIGNSRFNKKT